MAKTYGIEGFCYYHYWFGDGKMLLERPFNEVLDSGAPDYPFCLCWANETWSGIWFGETDKILIEQKKPDKKDLEKHFNYLIRAFNDTRYLTVDEKPIFQILSPGNLPNSIETTDMLRELAHRNGLKGLHLVAGYRCPEGWNPIKYGFDAVVDPPITHGIKHKRFIKRNIQRFLEGGYLGLSHFAFMLKIQKFLKRYYHVYNYEEFIELPLIPNDYDFEVYPCVLPNWDNTPRSGIQGYVLKNTTPQLLKKHMLEAVEYVQKYPEEHKIIFIKSWNEWAEGNYLEPDKTTGYEYLKVIRESVL